MSGREGLVDTAIKTSRTGYLSRRLMKTMENLIVRGGVVRDGPCIVQWKYGEAGGNPRLRRRCRKRAQRQEAKMYWEKNRLRLWDLDNETPDTNYLFVDFSRLCQTVPWLPGEEPE